MAQVRPLRLGESKLVRRGWGCLVVQWRLFGLGDPEPLAQFEQRALQSVVDEQSRPEQVELFLRGEGPEVAGGPGFLVLDLLAEVGRKGKIAGPDDVALVERGCQLEDEGNSQEGEVNWKVTVQVWGRPPDCRFTESLTPCPSGRWSTGPEARLTGRPEVQCR